MNSPEAPPLDTRHRASAWASLALVLLAAIPYLNAITHGGYVADDVLFLRDNPRAEDLGSMIVTGFTRPLWNLHRPDAEPVNPYYRPLTVTVLGATHALSTHPWLHHLVNVLLHVAVVLALARLLAHGVQPAVAWLAAGLFAIHPVHTEAIAWISGVMAPLAALFSLFALLAFRRGRERGTWTGLAALAFLLALLSYEAAVVLPGLALLLDRSGPNAPPLRSTLTRLLPWLGAALLVYGLRCMVFGSATAGTERSPDLGLTSSRLTLLRLEVFGESLRLLLWPSTLTTYREIDPNAADPWRLVSAVITLLALAFALVRLRGTPRLAAAWFLISMAPILLPLSLGRFPFSERFLYLPAMGFTLFLAHLLTRTLTLRGARPFAIAAVISLCLLSTLRVRERNRDFASEERFREAALALDPRIPQLQAERLAACLARAPEEIPFGDRDALHERRLSWARSILDALDDRIVTNNDLAPVLLLARRLSAAGDDTLAREVALRTGLR